MRERENQIPRQDKPADDWPIFMFLCRNAFSQQNLQDPTPITRSFRVANRGTAVSLPSPPRLHQQIFSFSMVIIPSIAPFHKEPQNPLSVFTVRGSGPSGPRLESPQDAKGQKTSQGSLYQPSNSGSWGLLHQTLLTLECAPEGLL